MNQPPAPARPSNVFYRVAQALAAALSPSRLMYLAHPINPFGTEQATSRPAPPVYLAELDAWLASSEAAYADLRPGTAKGVVWHGKPGQRSPWAVVYVHGFAASRLEMAPLSERVATRLGANLFYARLTGHGRGPTALAEARVQDWLADIQEALQIGRLLGQRVLLIGCSNGATLATWLALQSGGQADAYAFVSPNFGPRDKRSEFINAPWGRYLALALEGDMRGQPSNNLLLNQAWTCRYPTCALFPMMALVKRVRDSDLTKFRAPVLMLYAEGDETVDPARTRAAFARIGSTQKTLEVVTYSRAPGQHVLAGDLTAPDATEPMAQRIAQWAAGLESTLRK